MRKLALLFATLMLSCACAPDNGDTQTASGTSDGALRLRVATYNVHRLFDTTCDSASCGGSAYEPSVSEAAYHQKIADIASAIWTIDADIVLLQEIEKESALADLQSELSPKYYPSFAFGETYNTASLDVGILTRGNITQTLMYRAGYSYTDTSGTPRPLSRELLAAEITMPDGTLLTAFTTHFVSKVTDSVGDRRIAEAAYTQKMISDYISSHPDRFVVFGGDLNDYYTSPAVQALEYDNILMRDTRHMSPPDIYTWGNKADFDHLYHNAILDPYFSKAERVCSYNPSNGLNSSDHCALKSTYYIQK